MAHPMVPWPGGKRRLAKYLLPLFDTPHRCYVEPFAGAAAMLFARETPAKAEVLNDINGDLIRLYRCVQHHLEEFVRHFRWVLNSREMFNQTQAQNVDTLTDIQRAARFYYLQRLAFGGMVTNQRFGTSTTCPARLNLFRIEEELSQVHLRLSRVVIECLPWAECMARYDRTTTLFFLDPPYWRTEGYGVPFGLKQYEALAERMHALKGRAVLTINDHPDMRRVFAGFKMRRVPITYTLSGGGRERKATELIYTTR